MFQNKNDAHERLVYIVIVVDDDPCAMNARD
jgi:hypothetical protein